MVQGSGCPPSPYMLTKGGGQINWPSSSQGMTSLRPGDLAIPLTVVLPSGLPPFPNMDNALHLFLRLADDCAKRIGLVWEW